MVGVVFVTSNDNKAREASQVLGIDLKRKKLDLDEIQDMNLEKIIEHKARQAYRKLKTPIIVEDVGFYIDAWKGFPGPFIKWIHETMGYEVLPTLLKANRNVKWVVTYAYCDAKGFKSFTGIAKGTIAKKQMGSEGWGFDVLFIPDGQTKTIAELGRAMKPKFSARHKALKKLKLYLTK